MAKKVKTEEVEVEETETATEVAERVAPKLPEPKVKKTLKQGKQRIWMH